MRAKEKENLREWYLINQGIFNSFGKKVVDITKDLLDSEKIGYHSVTFRTKDFESFINKAKKRKYKNPKRDIKDICGIRVITYVNSEAEKVAEIIKKEFKINLKHSVDKSKDLGVDKVGYRSIHYVSKLSNDRLILPENRRFKNMACEIQIRTILQHTWAEIEHDRNYKYTGVLPPEIHRRFAILSGALELADREFDQISKSIDDYGKEVLDKTTTGDFAFEINSTSLLNYSIAKFGKFKGFLNFDLSERSEGLISELKSMNVKTLEDLENLIPKNFIGKVNKNKKLLPKGEKYTLYGMFSDAMITCNPELYFEKAWKKSHWNEIEAEHVDFIKALYAEYKIDISKYAEKYRFYLGE